MHIRRCIPTLKEHLSIITSYTLSSFCPLMYVRTLLWQERRHMANASQIVGKKGSCYKKSPLNTCEDWLSYLRIPFQKRMHNLTFIMIKLGKLNVRSSFRLNTQFLNKISLKKVSLDKRSFQRAQIRKKFRVYRRDSILIDHVFLYITN